MVDILEITKKIIELFIDNDLSRLQSVFVIESVKMTLHEEITKDIIKDATRSYNMPGVA